MKRTTNSHLTYILVLLSIIPSCLFAQHKTYIRVFDQNGIKFDQGWVQAITDTSVYLNDGKGFAFTLPVNSIGSIKTRKSGELIMITSTLVGAAAGAAIGLMVDQTWGFMYYDLGYDENAGLTSGTIAGAASGLIVGAVITSSSTRKFVIDGDLNKWQDFKTYVENRMK